MPNDQDKNQIPHPFDPETPRDYDPTHDKEFPHENTDITGNEHTQETGAGGYDGDMRDEQGRDVSMRQPGKFIFPDENYVSGEGWTVPTARDHGWNKAMDHPLEEQIDEPDNGGENK